MLSPDRNTPLHQLQHQRDENQSRSESSRDDAPPATSYSTLDNTFHSGYITPETIGKGFFSDSRYSAPKIIGEGFFSSVCSAWDANQVRAVRTANSFWLGNVCSCFRRQNHPIWHVSTHDPPPGTTISLSLLGRWFSFAVYCVFLSGPRTHAKCRTACLSCLCIFFIFFLVRRHTCQADGFCCLDDDGGSGRESPSSRSTSSSSTTSKPSASSARSAS